MKTWVLKGFPGVCFLILVLMFGMLAGCKGGGGSGPGVTPQNGSSGQIQLSGAVSAGGSGTGYTLAKSRSQLLYARTLSFLGLGTLAYAGAGDPTVDQVVAIPMQGGSLRADMMAHGHVAAIDSATGTFSLVLETDYDWLLMLVNSSATGTNRFVGSLALDAGASNSLLSLPATASTLSSIDLGTVSRASANGDALTSRVVGTADFSLSATELLAMAKTDELFRNAMNIVNNYEAYGNGAGKWYQLRPDFHWRGDLTSLDATSALSAAPSLTYTGMNFQLDQNLDNTSMNNVCTMAGIVALHPPLAAGIVTMGTKTYDYAHPIKNSGAGCQAWNGTAHQEAVNSDVYASDGYQNITYSIISTFPSGSIPSGFWEWKENGVVKAAFDLADINPPVTATGQLKGFIPAFKVNVDVNNKITSVDVAWFYYDGGSYIAVAPSDLAVLTHFVQQVEAKFDVTYNGTRRTCEMYIDPTVTRFDPADPQFASTCQADASHRDWYYQDPTHPETNTGLMGFYESGGFGYFFDYFPF